MDSVKKCNDILTSWNRLVSEFVKNSTSIERKTLYKMCYKDSSQVMEINEDYLITIGTNYCSQILARDCADFDSKNKYNLALSYMARINNRNK